MLRTANLADHIVHVFAGVGEDWQAFWPSFWTILIDGKASWQMNGQAIVHSSAAASLSF